MVDTGLLKFFGRLSQSDVRHVPGVEDEEVKDRLNILCVIESLSLRNNRLSRRDGCTVDGMLFEVPEFHPHSPYSSD